MSEATSVPFSELRAIDEINARAVTKEGLDELAASIASRGLIQPLAVRPADGGKYEIIDGRRRYMAIARLVKDKTWRKDQNVPVLVRNEDDADALESSLAANTVRLPMHPVDQHEVFARLADQGRTVDEIAASFGLATRTVRQHMALGKLAPEIRTAWKKGVISTGTAQAFTLHEDHGVQASVYASLRKEGQHALSEYRVRRELTRDRKRADCPELAFVGEDEYLAAGGTITESLFEEDRYVDDPALLDKLVRDGRLAICARLRSEGWGWAELDEDLPDDSFDWQDLADRREPVDFSSEEKARSGCIVLDMFDGDSVEIAYGVLRPEGAVAAADDAHQVDLEEAISSAASAPDADQPAEDDDSSPGTSPAQISNALAESISETLTLAAAETLARDGLLALRVAVAALEVRSGPARMHTSGWPGHRYQGARTFREVFKELVDVGSGPLMSRFAHAVAGSLDCRFFNAAQGPDEATVALRDALLPGLYSAAVREHFNVADYFKRANKDVALAALEEMEEAGAIRSLSADLSDAKKAELAELAATSAKACGWLPPELRHQVYELILPDSATQRLAGKDAAGEQASEVAA